MAKAKPIIALAAPVAITAAVAEGETKGPAKFSSTFYTGGALQIAGWENPVVVDLAGLKRGNVLVANLDHVASQRVGNFDVVNDGKTLVANGTATAKTAARDEVVGSAAEGYQWQASLEVNPHELEEVKAGKTVQVNGQSFTGPLTITRHGTLKGFAFVSHGADDNTSALIAAAAASNKEKKMKPEVKAWAESMGIDVDNATPEQIATIEANFEGREGKKPATIKASNPFEARKIEAARRRELKEIADAYIERHNLGEDQIDELERLHAHAIESKMTAQEFRLDLLENTFPEAKPGSTGGLKPRGLTNRVLEAAVCQTGNLANLEKLFKDEELQTAHDMFPHGIGLNQLICLAAEANGHRGISAGRVDLDTQRAAFGQQRQIRGSGFSGITITNVVAATANKFIHEGWMTVDQTCMKIAPVRNVRNFQTVTTVSLTGHLQYSKVGAAGEIKHGTLSDLTYTNQVDTYAAMLAITRQDIINDDIGALTAVPRRLGRGGMLKLNDIFWTEFLVLVSDSFFASGNNNINTGVADMTVGGLDATETIFMNQTDPDSKPLAIMPKILLVPSALKNKALTLMGSEGATYATAYATSPGDGNPFRGRFEVLSSPYISNSSYTGYTSTAWWMLADPNECAVIEIAALNGRVEPQVDTADADFNTLGIQMRGYSDVGVKRQEKRGGVHADGGSS